MELRFHERKVSAIAQHGPSAPQRNRDWRLCNRSPARAFVMGVATMLAFPACSARATEVPLETQVRRFLPSPTQHGQYELVAVRALVSDSYAFRPKFFEEKRVPIWGAAELDILEFLGATDPTFRDTGSVLALVRFGVFSIDGKAYVSVSSVPEIHLEQRFGVGDEIIAILGRGVAPGFRTVYWTSDWCGESYSVWFARIIRRDKDSGATSVVSIIEFPPPSVLDEAHKDGRIDPAMVPRRFATSPYDLGMWVAEIRKVLSEEGR